MRRKIVCITKSIVKYAVTVLMCLSLAGCQGEIADSLNQPETSEESQLSENSEAEVPEDVVAEQIIESTEAISEETSEDGTDGLGNTLDGVTVKPEVANREADFADQEETALPEPTPEDARVDLIFFMGQSNMSGCGGDATLAPPVSEEAGMEYRSVSDPTKLYPIIEPFGINENRIGGLMEYPGGKKGSLVSSFINKYHELTGRRVVAVSASKGETSISDFNSDAVKADIASRYAFAKSYLSNNGYPIGHIYVVWLQGESDALEYVDAAVYRTGLDDFMRPMFIDGLEKVFIITPGRTYDYKNLYNSIIDMQKAICKESGYYALATTVLTGVSTEYMTDMYHYNQHVLNLVGEEAAKSVAYYAVNNEKKIVYDYREQTYIVPDGVDPSKQVPDEPVDLTKINEMY